MNPEENFTTFQDEIFSSIMASVQTCGRIAAEDVGFQRSSDPDFNAALDETSARILDLASQLLKSASRGSDLAAPKMADIDDVDTKWTDAVEIVDFLLEKADTCLDEYTGAIKHKNPEPLPGALINTPQRNNVGRVQKANSWKSRQMAKPQLKFEGKIDNFDTSPFKPILRTKPHAVVSLQDSICLETNEEGVKQFSHPYKIEIETMEYPLRIYENNEPIMYRSYEETIAVWVDTKEALGEMIDELKQATEIAVDLEHHDTRSYIGFTCLMQISTRNNDWIIDTLSLRLELQALNEVFADPKIIKVLHGCYMDVKWLQRDFGLYLVGLFDTHFAAKILGFPGLGLAYLLKKYVGFHADKQYQLADWRIRPLTPEMFNYARSDTHFLLYIFDCVRNELVDRSDPTNPEEDRMQRVLQDSKEAALKRYEREAYDAENGSGPGGWYNMIWRGHLDTVQEAVFKAVHQWRDTAAREEDEGLHYTMPKHQMNNLARQMPTDVNTLLRICTPTSHIVRARAGELVVLIRDAKENAQIVVPNEVEPSPPPMAAPVSTMSVAPVVPVVPVVPAVEPHTPMAPKNNTFNPKYSLANVFGSKPAVVPEIHAEKSTFWGGAFGSSRWEAVRTVKADANGEVRLAIPLPQLTAAVFMTAEEQDRPIQKTVDPGARAEHEYVKATDRQRKKEEDIIVVKSLGGTKRKLEEATDSNNCCQSNTPAQYVEDFRGATPEDSGESLRKRTKKEKKHKAQEEDDEEVRGNMDPRHDKSFDPFDYSKAPPVFNTHKQQKAGRMDGNQQKQPKKVFDPYSGSGDGPRGMGRGQRERSGKSHTFKQ